MPNARPRAAAWMPADRLLFIVKKRECDWGGYGGTLSSGLRNSVCFLIDMLTAIGLSAAMVEVTDNNDIDRAVTRARPTHCLIEAFWVVPEKFDVLTILHPDVRWIVRNHSEMPFLASEGIALGWIAGYLRRGVEVMCNAPRALADVRAVALAYGVSDRLVTFGPNFYPVSASPPMVTASAKAGGPIHIGCFGAIRPLKNQLAQAVAACEFGRRVRRPIMFHVNASRVEGNGDPLLKNLREMFDSSALHTLVEHPWLPHTQFVDTLRGMDVLMQVSFSETFNIVAADATAAGVPGLVSSEMPWAGSYAQADPTDIGGMASALVAMFDGAPSPVERVAAQRRGLLAYGRDSEAAWRERFASPACFS